MPFSVQHFMVLMNFEVLFWALKNTFGQLICSFFGAEFDCYLFGRFCRGFFDSEWFFELRFEVFKLLVANLSVFGVENENITCNPLSDLLDFRYISLPSPIRTFSCKKSPEIQKFTEPFPPSQTRNTQIYEKEKKNSVVFYILIKYLPEIYVFHRILVFNVNFSYVLCYQSIFSFFFFSLN